MPRELSFTKAAPIDAGWMVAVDWEWDASLSDADNEMALFKEEEDAKQFLKEKGAVGILTWLGRELIGYGIGRKDKHGAMVIRVAISEEHRREGHGGATLAEICKELRSDNLRCIVPETEMSSLLFLRSCEWKAVKVLKDRYDGEDGIAFRRQVKVEKTT
jgi:GNAT superfamily N-acetyltransferase